MGIFRQFPYSNFHEINLDWIIRQVKEVKETLDNFIIDTTNIIVDTVNQWLVDHPEATTTVQDGSLTAAKFTETLKIQTIKDYVTPQMYGAKADGVTDDTSAIQLAIDNNQGGTVVFPHGEYRISAPLKTYRSKDRFTNLILATDAVIKPLDYVDYIFDIGGYDESFPFEVGYKKYISGGTLDANSMVNIANIMIRSEVKDVDLSDMVILTYGNSALILGDSTGTSQDAYIHHVTMENERHTHTGDGFIINSSDNNIDSLRVYYYERDLVINGGAIFVENVHTLAFVDFITTHVSFLINSSMVFLQDCYGDGTEIFARITGTNTKLCVSQCEYYSYTNNHLTAFDMNDISSRLKLSQFYMNCSGQASDPHIGIKVNSFNTFLLRTSNHMISMEDITIDNAENLRNGDILKGGQAKNGYITFHPTGLPQNTWFKVGSFQWTPESHCVFNIEFMANGRLTKLPLHINVNANGSMTYDIHSGKVISDDAASYKIGFNSITHDDFGRIDMFIEQTSSLSRTLEQVRFISPQAVIPSTDTSRVRNLDSMGTTYAPAETFTINCQAGTIVHD